MKNRSILARMAAKKPMKKAKKAKATLPPPEAEKAILATNPETGEVEGTFATIEKAVEGGFNGPNIKRSIKNGTKYKGHLWVISE